ncbi:hypothetical protein GGF31_000148 [Allomyces arbusculus]|nr:hypothetical protein GGF31_000148 [Allomyces arbusculus]
MDMITVFILLTILFATVGFFTGPSGPRRYPVTEEMVSQVVALFPDVDRTAARNDLQLSGSIEATVENILAGKVRRQAAGAGTAPTGARTATATAANASPASTRTRWEGWIRGESLQAKRMAMVAEFRPAFLAKEAALAAQAVPGAGRSKAD